MRYFFSARLWKALGVLLAVAVVLIGALNLINQQVQSETAQSHIVDVVASVATSEFGEGWQGPDRSMAGSCR